MAEQQSIKCAIVVGIREDGSVFLETHGTEQNLITIDGLLEYGKRYVEDEWEARKTLPQAGTETEVVEADEIIPPVVEPKPKKKPVTRKKKEAIINVEV